MKITEADMESRQRMANLRCALTDAMDSKQFDDITYAEILIVLAELTKVWAGYLRQEDMKEGDR